MMESHIFYFSGMIEQFFLNIFTMIAIWKKNTTMSEQS